MKTAGGAWKARQREYEIVVSKGRFRAGDTVLISKKVDSLTKGWSAFWSELNMTPRIGQTGTVVSLEGCAGIRVEFSDGESYNFPYHSLELVY